MIVIVIARSKLIEIRGNDESFLVAFPFDSPFSLIICRLSEAVRISVPPGTGSKDQAVRINVPPGTGLQTKGVNVQGQGREGERRNGKIGAPAPPLSLHVRTATPYASLHPIS